MIVVARPAYEMRREARANEEFHTRSFRCLRGAMLVASSRVTDADDEEVERCGGCVSSERRGGECW